MQYINSYQVYLISFDEDYFEFMKILLLLPATCLILLFRLYFNAEPYSKGARLLLDNTVTVLIIAFKN